MLNVVLWTIEGFIFLCFGGFSGDEENWAAAAQGKRELKYYFICFVFKLDSDYDTGMRDGELPES